MTTLTLPSPAKINLFLHVCGKRADGYHNLQTAFQFLDIEDTISFATQERGITLNCNLEALASSDNLITKAAKALQQATNTKQGAAITLTKRLPMGGGIGGGSSNAATTLLALNKLWHLNLSTEQLMEIGAKLGADVPIFIHGHSAWAEGIGEKLTDINPQESWYVLVKPNTHVETARIFSHPQLTRNTKMKRIAAFLEHGTQESFQNDCQALVRKLYPEVDEALTVLSNFGNAQMTGTGACVFLTCKSKHEAEKICAKMPDNFQAWVTKGLNTSPLKKALGML